MSLLYISNTNISVPLMRIRVSSVAVPSNGNKSEGGSLMTTTCLPNTNFLGRVEAKEQL
jgi:hypothetical protein